MDDSTKIQSRRQEMEVHRAFPPKGPGISSQHMAATDAKRQSVLSGISCNLRSPDLSRMARIWQGLYVVGTGCLFLYPEAQLMLDCRRCGRVEREKPIKRGFERHGGCSTRMLHELSLIGLCFLKFADECQEDNAPDRLLCLSIFIFIRAIALKAACCCHAC